MEPLSDRSLEKNTAMWDHEDHEACPNTDGEPPW